jgi:hypothetical protein
MLADEEEEEAESKGLVFLLLGRGGCGSLPCNFNRRSLNQGGSARDTLPSSHQASMGGFREPIVDDDDDSSFRRREE